MISQRLLEQDYLNKQTSGLLDPSTATVNNQAESAQEETKRLRYIKPRPFPHKHNQECAYDYVCHQNECRILQKLVCNECAPYVHPNHTIDSLAWYLNFTREKIKRKDGSYKNAVDEIKLAISEQQKKRKKYYKFMIRQMVKVEKECRAIENFSLQKVMVSMSSGAHRDAFLRLVRLIKQVHHPKLDQFARDHPEFNVKQEEADPGILGNELQRADLFSRISEIIDQLFLADERDREKRTQLRDRSPSPKVTTKQLRFLGEKWERNMHRIAGATKRFTKRMLMESRMSIRSNQLRKQVVDVDLKLEDDEQAPKVLQILPVTQQLLITVHPNEVRLWKYNGTTYQDFKPITALALVDLKHVAVSEERAEFLLLHGQHEIWAINTRNAGAVSRIYQTPILELRLSKLLISGCQTLLFASGGCNQNGFYILCWSYHSAQMLRVMRHQYSFPHEGDLLTSYAHQHLFRCNRNSVDVFQVLEGAKTQTIVLASIRDFIEEATVLRKFQESDALCISTNKGSFYVYAYDDSLQENNYKMVHSLTSGTLSTYHVFYQHGLAEEGFFQAVLENNETKVLFTDLNNKIVFRGIQFNDQVLCGRLEYQRNPYINQLIMIMGFQSGMLRIVKFVKN